MVDVAVEHRHLAGAAKALVAVARHVHTGGLQSLQQGAVGRHLHLQLRVAQLGHESMFPGRVQRRAEHTPLLEPFHCEATRRRQRQDLTAKRRTDDIDDVGATAIAIEPKGFSADLKLKLHAAVDALSEKLRPVFVMHDVEGYTHEEIAGSLGIPVGTSKARLFDARAKLRLALQAFAGDHIA